jgi:hypothetical protein
MDRESKPSSGVSSRLDSLIQRFEYAGIDGCNDVNRSVEFFFRQPGFPCVRKAALRSGIAQAHHRNG